MVQTDEETGLALTLDGERITTGRDIATLRGAGLDELRIRAALAGRPVRARAVEPASPIPWCMIVCPDGAVLGVAEHPTPPAPPTHPAATALPAPYPLPALLGSAAYREMWAAVWAHHAAGDLPAAVAAAYRLETALAGRLGDLDASTVTVLTARAWLTLCQRTDWRGTTELLITTALRCQAARYRPEVDTRRTARNAHACWRQLRRQDPQAAADLAGPLADMLAILGEDDLRGGVLAWAPATASR
ncbi:hypothetical protein ACFXG6_32915 [Streptomyces roseus]|uniref:hypothetical protein n=1 Tax=Streptomyces roseus TaxID=66430 RepID=UPI0036BEDADE